MPHSTLESTQQSMHDVNSKANSTAGNAPMSDNRLRIGKIVGCHGIRGDLKVLPCSENAEWSEELDELILEMPAFDPKKAKKGQSVSAGKQPKVPQTQRLQIESVRWQGACVLVKFAGYPDRTAAEVLIGATVYADANELPEAEEGEYWVDDIIGLTVLDANTGQKLGVVADLLSSTGSEFLEIRLDNDPETVVIPFLDHFFPTVDLEAETVTLNLPAGFLPDNEPKSDSDNLNVAE
jgi:16S rRNA processing protein RimM